MNKTSSSTPSSQRGMMLIEALMAILIFSLGILGMVGVNALAVSSQSDAQYRTEANRLATQIINQIWLSVDRSGTGTAHIRMRQILDSLVISVGVNCSHQTLFNPPVII